MESRKPKNTQNKFDAQFLSESRVLIASDWPDFYKDDLSL